MSRHRRFQKLGRLGLLCALAWMSMPCWASEYRGQVVSGGLPVPGATVTATQGKAKTVAVTDSHGLYFFADLVDGSWDVTVEMLCYEPTDKQVVVAPGIAPASWELTMLPLDRIRAELKPGAGSIQPMAPVTAHEVAKNTDGSTPTPESAKIDDEQAQRAADGLLINGTINNAATSKYSLAQAIGNNRAGGKALYNGGLGVTFDDSVFDAQPYSLSGIDSPKAPYNRVTGLFTFGGPLRIPRLLRNGPTVTLAYQWTRNRYATTVPALVPTQAEHALANAAGNPQAALLSLYPLPNIVNNARYNYQTSLLSSTHQDALQFHWNESIKHEQLYGDFALQSSRTGSPNLFNFLDTTDVLGMVNNMHWSHRLTRGKSFDIGYRFSRLRTLVRPYWADRENFSQMAGILGNNQDPSNWGPPTLVFSSGIATLTDGNSYSNRNQDDALLTSFEWDRSRHNITVGFNFQRRESNYLSEANPRGTLTFTGAAKGTDISDFLAGVPDTSAIATGNPDKYLRQSVYAAYLNDDWRVRSDLTINAGVRWEYGAPMTELKNRLVNLDVASGFTGVADVLASDPHGPLTGMAYPTSLIRPDKAGFMPKVGLSWRPIPGSSIVVRAGYGVYVDTSVYPTMALQLAQQPPLSKTFNVSNATCPLTLTNGFNTCPATVANTFAVDPNFRVGYAQNWQLSVQRDLPASLQMTVTYLGIKGTRGNQEFLPNTYPIGAANPCPSCPAGFAYLTSNGNSTREAAQIQLRRRLHNGFTASAMYTYSKSIDDDAALGGQGPVQPGVSATLAAQPTLAIAQNWRNLSGERGLSTFDQRHLLNASAQYTSGMGKGGGALLSGWRGVALKEWTISTLITAGTGTPETPIYLAAVPGAGVVGTIRPSLTGAPIYARPAGYFLNNAAYTAPAAGQWGNAARDSITGPSLFTLNASFGRVFRLEGRYNLDFSVASANFLNHVTYTGWNTIIGNTQFGLPAAANTMRSMQILLRLRY